MKTLVFSAVGVLALCGAASAAFSDFEQQNQSWSFPLSPGNQDIIFNQFDTMGGTRVLKGVRMDVEGAMQAGITAENDSALPVADFGVSMTGIVDVDVAVLSATLGIFQAAGPVSVGASDGVLDSGPDFHDFGVVSGSDSDTDFTGPAAIWIGGGTIMGSVIGNGGFAASGTSDATLQFSDFGTTGKVTLTYFFDVIPTPGAASLAGLACIAGLRRRRD